MGDYKLKGGFSILRVCQRHDQKCCRNKWENVRVRQIRKYIYSDVRVHSPICFYSTSGRDASTGVILRTYLKTSSDYVVSDQQRMSTEKRTPNMQEQCKHELTCTIIQYFIIDVFPLLILLYFSVAFNFLDI